MTLRTDSPAELRRTFRLLVQTGVWLFACMMWGASGHHHQWVYVLLTFAALYLIPLGEKLLVAKGLPGEQPFMAFPILFSLFLALSLPPGTSAGLHACLWLLVRGVHAVMALWHWNKHRTFAPAELCLLAAAVFPAVGAAWLVAFCAGWRPFGFDALIVLLTAAHFHHAGFTLPLIAGLIARARPGRWTSRVCIAVLAGVPLVAAGITCTHFGRLPWVEPLGVTLLVLGAFGVAIGQLRLACDDRARAAFLISGASLLIAMLLAFGFGLRHIFPTLALPMPQMWAIHGSLNAFGFGLFGLVAWHDRTTKQ